MLFRSVRRLRSRSVLYSIDVELTTGNPIGGLVFTSAYGQLQQAHEWTNFMSAEQFCIRACKDGPRAPQLCQHIYDVMGCAWNMPGNYDAGTFERCQGDTGEVRYSILGTMPTTLTSLRYHSPWESMAAPHSIKANL